MKDLVEKFIVLQIQTAPSRLQHASAGCFLAVMFYQVLHPGFAGQNMILLPEGRYIAMRNETHFI